MTAMRAQKGTPRPTRAALSGASVPVMRGMTRERPQLAALNAVTAMTAVDRAPANEMSHCPMADSATARSASAMTPRAFAPAVMAGRKALPMAMARFLTRFPRSWSAFLVVLALWSNSDCMDPAYLALSRTRSKAWLRLSTFWRRGAMAPMDSSPKSCVRTDI